LHILFWPECSRQLPLQFAWKKEPDNLPRIAPYSANGVREAAGGDALPVVEDVVVLDEAMEILAVEDGPQQGAVRKKEALPLITGCCRHGEGIRVIADHPFTDGGLADLPVFFLVPTVGGCPQELVIDSQGNRQLHGRGGVLSSHGLLAFAR
jgi:hypothetical protein